MISGFEWLPNKVTWFIDGRVVRTHYGGRPPIPDKSAKIMMNLWIFGPKANFGGKQIYNNRYPMTSEYAPWPKLMVLKVRVSKTGNFSRSSAERYVNPYR